MDDGPVHVRRSEGYFFHREHCQGDAVTGYSLVNDGPFYACRTEGYFVNSTESIA